MKSKKTVILTVLGILLVSAVLTYRKYQRKQLRESQVKEERKQAAQIFEYQRKQDSIKLQQERDSLQRLKALKAQKQRDELEAQRNQLRENMKKLEQEIQTKKGS